MLLLLLLPVDCTRRARDLRCSAMDLVSFTLTLTVSGVCRVRLSAVSHTRNLCVNCQSSLFT